MSRLGLPVFNVFPEWQDSIPFAQWSLGVLGADSALPFALTNSGHFRLRRTAHWADVSLVCHGLLVPKSPQPFISPVFAGFGHF